MRMVHRLNQSIRKAGELGIQVRMEYLDGKPGGICWFADQYWLFVDLALSVADQLDQVDEGLRQFRAKADSKAARAA